MKLIPANMLAAAVKLGRRPEPKGTLEYEIRRWEARGRKMPESILEHLNRARDLRGPFEPRGSLNTWSETLYSSTATETAITAAAETVVYPASTVPGYYGGIPGGYMIPHRTLHLRCAGQLSTPATTPGTMLWRLRWGGVAGTALVASNGAGATGTAIAPSVSQTNVFWRAEWYITARGDLSTTAALFASGILETEAVPTKFAVTFPLTAPATVNADTTVFKDLALTYTETVATASFAGMQYTLESMN